jgi:hypothetical protein
MFNRHNYVGLWAGLQCVNLFLAGKMRGARRDLGMGEIAKFSNQLRSSISDPVAPEGSFYDQVVRLLDRIEYRRADSAAEREALFRLRYQAYMRDGTIAPNAEGMFSDPYDDRGNVYLFGLYLDGSWRARCACTSAPPTIRTSRPAKSFPIFSSPSSTPAK